MSVGALENWTVARVNFGSWPAHRNQGSPGFADKVAANKVLSRFLAGPFLGFLGSVHVLPWAIKKSHLQLHVEDRRNQRLFLVNDMAFCSPRPDRVETDNKKQCEGIRAKSGKLQYFSHPVPATNSPLFLAPLSLGE